MRHSGPIIIVEDDADDQELMEQTFKALDYPNEILYFSDGLKALNFIENNDNVPFFILSDINMPLLNGFELRKRIQHHEKTKIRCIPFLFFTTGAERHAVEDIYAMSVQGFFIKPNTMKEFQNKIRSIVEYWSECYSPVHDSNPQKERSETAMQHNNSK